MSIVLDEWALKDFGTTDISPHIRGKARRLAKELGCTPLEALNILKEKLRENEVAQKMKSDAEKIKNELKTKRQKELEKRKKKAGSKNRHIKPGQPKYAFFIQGGAPGLKSQ